MVGLINIFAYKKTFVAHISSINIKDQRGMIRFNILVAIIWVVLVVGGVVYGLHFLFFFFCDHLCLKLSRHRFKFIIQSFKFENYLFIVFKMNYTIVQKKITLARVTN